MLIINNVQNDHKNVLIFFYGIYVFELLNLVAETFLFFFLIGNMNRDNKAGHQMCNWLQERICSSSRVKIRRKKVLTPNKLQANVLNIYFCSTKFGKEHIKVG